MKKKILFLCTGNSCRSQMAEGLARKILDPNKFEVYSAGTKPSFVDPRAIKVMAEIGIDISNHTSKSVDEFKDIDFYAVITVCDKAKETCPLWVGKASLRLHHSFEDPPLLAKGAKTEEEALLHYRRIRDEIKKFIEALRI
ncbi:MAG: arsenate reductase ArsC [Elusimicrobiota bacterium]